MVSDAPGPTPTPTPAVPETPESAGEATWSFDENDGVLFNAGQTLLHTYPTGKTDRSYSIPASVATIEMAAFWDCNYLSSVTIPAGVTTIDISAFANCFHLTDIYYGGSEGQWAQISIGVKKRRAARRQHPLQQLRELTGPGLSSLDCRRLFALYCIFRENCVPRGAIQLFSGRFAAINKFRQVRIWQDPNQNSSMTTSPSPC